LSGVAGVLMNILILSGEGINKKKKQEPVCDFNWLLKKLVKVIPG
jgi:hypothetical protein